MSANLQQSLPIAFAAWLLFSSIRRALLIRRLPVVRSLNSGEWVRFASHMAGGFLLAAAMLPAAIMLFSSKMFPPIGFLAFAVAASTMTDAIKLLRECRANKRDAKKAAIQISMLWCAGAVGLGFVICLRSIPSCVERIETKTPVEGRWRVEAGGRFGLTNAHHGNPNSQNLAIDLVKEGDADASLGQPVEAPIDGEIARAIGNRMPGEEDPEGNVIVIRSADGIELTLAHLQENSIRVSKGQIVHAGEMVANCGTTGSATIAHLHIHAQRGDLPVALLIGSDKKFYVRGDVLDPAN